ncbi:MAG: hypothetical protein GEV09_18595 [Pseudonocardiaceae bacterium]|nr:hypothetical protein [Pseudonocardiaceae bacterium]
MSGNELGKKAPVTGHDASWEVKGTLEGIEHRHDERGWSAIQIHGAIGTGTIALTARIGDSLTDLVAGPWSATPSAPMRRGARHW